MKKDQTSDQWVLDQMQRKDEPLHPELQKYLQESDQGLGTVLRHPLVYQVPYMMASLANDAYAAKKRNLRRARARKDWHTVIWLHERPWRMTALLQYQSRMSENEFWIHARNVWVDSENVWQHLDEWVELMAESPDFICTISAEDAVTLAALPEPIVVYRGAALERNEDGLSYTLDHDRAAWFARRWKRDDPVVIHAEVPHAEVAMYVTERGENEIVVRSLESIHVTSYEEVGSTCDEDAEVSTH